jgi:hypothetical protein
MSRRQVDDASYGTAQTTWTDIVVPALESRYTALEMKYDGNRDETKSPQFFSALQLYLRIYDICTSDQLVAMTLRDKFQLWLSNKLNENVLKPAVTLHDDDEMLRFLEKRASAIAEFMPFVKASCHVFLEGCLTTLKTERLVTEAFARVRKSVVLLREINLWRSGRQVNLTSLTQDVRIFVTLRDFQKAYVGTSSTVFMQALQQFEQAYLDNSRAMYHQTAAVAWTGASNHSAYLGWIDSCFERESALERELQLPVEWRPAMRAGICEVLLAPYLRAIVEPRCGWNVPDVARMYSLLTFLSEALTRKGCETGSDKFIQCVTTTSSGTMDFDWHLLAANARCHRLIHVHFEGSPLLDSYRKVGFRPCLEQMITHYSPRTSSVAAVNDRASNFGEVLAAFVDAVMRRTLPGADYRPTMERLEGLAQLAADTIDKDAFQQCHKEHLAQRLLLSATDAEWELKFLKELQRRLGASFTQSMHVMLLDADSMTEMASAGLPCECTVRVLNQAHWPPYRCEPLLPPASLRICLDSFSRLYRRSHPTYRRKLSWVHVLGRATLVVSFPEGVKELQVSLHQACLLLTIDEMGHASVQDVASALGIGVTAVTPLVESMHRHVLLRLLARVDEKDETHAIRTPIADVDRFAINARFAHADRDIKIPSAKTPAEPLVNKRREAAIDAAIVGIMKSRGSIAYAELQELVIAQLASRFRPQPKDIKLSVEGLLEREYLSRDTDDQEILVYVV